jgi:hypothetical protein
VTDPVVERLRFDESECDHLARVFEEPLSVTNHDRKHQQGELVEQSQLQKRSDQRDAPGDAYVLPGRLFSFSSSSRRSPLRSVEFCHSTESSEVETTNLWMGLMKSA